MKWSRVWRSMSKSRNLCFGVREMVALHSLLRVQNSAKTPTKGGLACKLQSTFDGRAVMFNLLWNRRFPEKGKIYYFHARLGHLLNTMNGLWFKLAELKLCKHVILNYMNPAYHQWENSATYFCDAFNNDLCRCIYYSLSSPPCAHSIQRVGISIYCLICKNCTRLPQRRAKGPIYWACLCGVKMANQRPYKAHTKQSVNRTAVQK